MTIQSVKNQTFKEIEIIVVDDGSTDGSGVLVDKLAEKDKRIKKIVQKNSGVSAARNMGFKHSNGEYIAYLDADDVWLPENLELKLSKLRQGNFGMVHSNAQLINAEGKITEQILRGCEGNLLDGLLAGEQTQVPGPSSILIPKKTMLSAGLFDEQLSTSADKDFFIRVAALLTIGHLDQVTWYYRLHRKNMHKNITLMQHDIIRVYKKAKYAGLFNSRKFERRCFANMYLVLAASWAGDGKHLINAVIMATRAFLVHPSFFFTSMLRRLYK